MSKLIRKEKKYKIEEILPHVIFTQTKTRIDIDGDMIKMSSSRLQCFAKYGIRCTKCGIEGQYFYKEYHKENPSFYHLNLYAVDENGKEILMTKDHKVSKSNGGEDTLENYQPMCFYCNIEKGDKNVL